MVKNEAPTPQVNTQDLIMEYEMIRQEVANIDAQIRQLQEHHEALIVAKESINSIKGNKGSEMLVPGGAGVYFNTSLNNDKSCLVNVGANVIIEMNIKKADKTISDRVDQALSMIVKLNEEADMMVQRLRLIESVIQSGQQPA